MKKSEWTVWMQHMLLSNAAFMVLFLVAGALGLVHTYFMVTIALRELLMVVFMGILEAFLPGHGKSQRGRAIAAWGACVAAVSERPSVFGLWWAKCFAYTVAFAVGATYFGELRPVIAFSTVAIAMCISVTSGVHAVLLFLNERDPSWLAGSGGRIGAPNWCTLIRLPLPLVAPYLVAAQPLGAASYVIALVILLVAVLLDALDGQLAHRMNMMSKAGKMLDPVADKIIVYPMIVALWMASGGTFLAPWPWGLAAAVSVWGPILLIVARDLMYLLWFLRCYGKLPNGMAANGLDKARAVAMFVWVCAMLLALGMPGLPLWVAALAWLRHAALVAAGALSVSSGLAAVRRIRNVLPKSDLGDKK